MCVLPTVLDLYVLALPHLFLSSTFSLSLSVCLSVCLSNVCSAYSFPFACSPLMSFLSSEFYTGYLVGRCFLFFLWPRSVTLVCHEVCCFLPEYQDCFTLHDKDGNGRVPIQSLGSVVRSLGITPTEETIHRIARNQIRTF